VAELDQKTRGSKQNLNFVMVVFRKNLYILYINCVLLKCINLKFWWDSIIYQIILNYVEKFMNYLYDIKFQVNGKFYKIYTR
jgi:hypothetical protein